MARTWNFRYFAQKIELGLREALEHKSPATTLSDCMRVFYGVFNKPLTSEIYMGGRAMLPTLGQPAEGGEATSAKMEKLLVRHIRDPSPHSIFIGDVIAFSNPMQAASKASFLVRRVAALEGDEMVSSDPDDEPFAIRAGDCWVLADNASLEPAEAQDSRTFGPVALSSVLGRVVYYKRSAAEHGVVENSEAARWMDEPVLECEVDLEQV